MSVPALHRHPKSLLLASSLATPAPSLADLRSPATLLRHASVALASTALLALCAHIALPLPFTPVPGTMQTFAVLLLAMVLGPVLGPITMLTYLAEGAAGLPVFAPSSSLLFFGPTFGYLASFPIAAFVAAIVYQRTLRSLPSLPSAFLAGILASIPIFAIGAIWLGLWAHLSAHNTMQLGVLPFLPGEIVKLTLAALAIASLHRFASNQLTSKRWLTRATSHSA